MTHGQKASIIIEPAKALENYHVLSCWFMLLLAQALGCTRLKVIKPLHLVRKVCSSCCVSWRHPKPSRFQFPPSHPGEKRPSCCRHPHECQETKTHKGVLVCGTRAFFKPPSKLQGKKQRVPVNLRQGDKLPLLIKQ